MNTAQQRRDPAQWASVALALLVHLALAAFLFFGVRWQSEPPAAVQVSLVSQPAITPAPPPKPAAPKPAPAPEPKPAPKLEPKPEPKPAPPPPPKAPDIKVPEKKPEPKPEPKPVPKPAPKPAPKPEPKPQKKPAPTPPDRAKAIESSRMDELLAMDAQRAREAALLRQEANAAARNRTMAAYKAKIQGKVKANIVLPLSASGNPEAVFEVTQATGGVVLNVRLVKSTGDPALDDAIKRAIQKSDPLPEPDDPALFNRILILTFRPLEP